MHALHFEGASRVAMPADEALRTPGGPGIGLDEARPTGL